MSTLRTTVRRGLVITAAAAAAGPGLAAVAQAGVGPTAVGPIDAASIANIIEPSDAGTTVDGATQFADTIPVGRSVQAPSLSALPLAGPLAGGLPMAGPATSLALPVLSGVAGGLPVAGPLVQGLPLLGSMVSPAHSATTPATRSVLPQGTPLQQGLATSVLPSVNAPALSSLPGMPSLSSLSAVSSLPQGAMPALGQVAPQLPLVSSLPTGNLPLVGSVLPQVTNLLHF